RRIQVLFNNGIESMDFINEQYVVRLQVCQQSSEVAGFIEDRPGRDLDVRLKFVGDNMRQGSLAESRRSVQQHMIERFTSLLRRRNEYFDVVNYLLLTCKIIERQRTQSFFNFLLRCA